MLKSPTIKLLMGIVFIGLIVVATFAYGRSQREAAIKTSPSPLITEQSTDVSPEPSVAQGQGGGESTPAPTPALTATPEPAVTTLTPAPAAVAATVDNKGGTSEAPSTIPDTGSALDYALPLGILTALFAVYRKTINQNRA